MHFPLRAFRSIMKSQHTNRKEAPPAKPTACPGIKYIFSTFRIAAGNEKDDPMRVPPERTAPKPRLPFSIPILGVFFTALIIFSFIVFHVMKRPELKYDFETKQLEVELQQPYTQSVLYWNSTMNACKWPIIQPHEPEINKFIKYYRNPNCVAQIPPLASLLDDGKLLISSPVNNEKFPKIRCTMAGLSGGLYPRTREMLFGAEVEVKLDTPTPVSYDEFAVRCYNVVPSIIVNGTSKPKQEIVYEKNFVHFAPNAEKVVLADALPMVDADPERPSMVILVLDSTSLNQFQRHAPDSYAFMQENDFLTFNMYNKIADNSGVNLLPITAGRPIQRNPNSTDPEGEKVDLEETTFLWDLMKARGCVTLLNDDIDNAARGLFHYPAKSFQGFRKKPTDFYLRASHLFNVLRRQVPKTQNCLKDGTLGAIEYLDYTKRFSLAYGQACHFSFSFLTGLTHNEPSLLGLLDKEIRQTLESFFAHHLHQNTVMVIMGDHGNRISGIQRTTTGRVEERAPLFSMRIPEKWREKHPLEDKYLRTNANRLVSNFDLHQTLRHLALAGQPDTEPSNYGQNLFTAALSNSRMCEEAHIPPNFCLCMDLKENKSAEARNDTAVYQQLFGRLSQQVMALPCVKAIHWHPRYSTLQIFTLNQMVLHGLRNAKDYDKVKNVTAASDFEWVEIGLIAELQKRSAPISGEISVSVAARYRHRLSTDEYELAETPRLVEKSQICNAPNIEQMCEMCFYDNLFDPRKTSQVS
ncbi:unnamed protein product, partial [Mesorhabditis spiculigera]